VYQLGIQNVWTDQKLFIKYYGIYEFNFGLFLKWMGMKKYLIYFNIAHYSVARRPHAGSRIIFGFFRLGSDEDVPSLVDDVGSSAVAITLIFGFLKRNPTSFVYSYYFNKLQHTSKAITPCLINNNLYYRNSIQ